jgi:hypothetical protein
MPTYNETRLDQLYQEFLNLKTSKECCYIIIPNEQLRLSHISECDELIDKCLTEYEKYDILVKKEKKSLTDALQERRNKVEVANGVTSLTNVAEAKQT